MCDNSGQGGRAGRKGLRKEELDGEGSRISQLAGFEFAKRKRRISRRNTVRARRGRKGKGTPSPHQYVMFQGGGLVLVGR